MNFWPNLIGYQIVWFAAVAGAARGSQWPALACAGAFVAWQAWTSQRRGAELRLAAAAVGCGLVLDGSMAGAGWLRHASPFPALPPGGAPLWILALWAAFAMTLNHSLAYLRERPWIAAAAGAVGGPLAYWGAGRGWQAVAFEAPAGRALAALAMGWALAMLLLTRLARRWSGDGRPACAGPSQGARP